MSDLNETKPEIKEVEISIPQTKELKEEEIPDEKIDDIMFVSPHNTGDDENSSESDEEQDEDFKKFDRDIKTNVLLDYHPELKQISYEEMMTLATIIRDKNGIIIDPLHTTIPILTRYEQAKIVGLRAKQINGGSNPFVDVSPDIIDGITIALEEFKQKKIPFVIRRPLPNGISEYWKMQDLEILEA
jgi:DNA-directed RNA polymerase subunit K/omega